MHAALVRTAELLKGLGHDVFEQDIGVDYRALYRAQGLASASNFSANVRRWVDALGREPGPDELGPLARRGYESGKRLNGQQAFWGFQELRILNRQIVAAYEGFDVFLQPVMATPAPRGDWLYPLMEDVKEFDKRQAATYGTTPPANFTGQPSLSLPLWQSESGLPIGMMFTAKFADEATLYRLAGQLEKEAPWKDRRPPVWG
jgi:amidase